jgi:hypothetical protein
MNRRGSVDFLHVLAQVILAEGRCGHQDRQRGSGGDSVWPGQAPPEIHSNAGFHSDLFVVCIV